MLGQLSSLLGIPSLSSSWTLGVGSPPPPLLPPLALQPYRPPRPSTATSSSRLIVFKRDISRSLLLLLSHMEFNAAVHSATGRGVVISNGLAFAVTAGRDTAAIHAFANQIVAYRIGTALGQAFVVLGGTNAVGMAGHFHADIVVFRGQRAGNA